MINQQVKALTEDLLISAKYHSYEFSHNGTELILSVISEECLPERVISMLNPYISAKKKQSWESAGPYTLFLISKSRWAPLRKLLPQYGDRCLIHCNMDAVMFHISSDVFPVYTRTLYHDIEYFLWNSNTVLMIGDYEDFEFHFDIIRIVRGIFEVQLFGFQFMKLHLGMVQVRDKGYGFVGAKNSGKSTLICRFLEEIDSSSFCSNDKTYVKLINDGFLGCGIPQRIGIKPGTISQYPGLDKVSMYRNSGKTFFSLQEFTRYFGRNIVPASKIHAIILSAIDHRSHELSVRRVQRQSVEPIFNMDENLFSFSDVVNANWLVSLLTGSEDDRDLLVNKAKQKLFSIPWFLIEGNPWLDNFDTSVLRVISSQ